MRRTPRAAVHADALGSVTGAPGAIRAHRRHLLAGDTCACRSPPRGSGPLARPGLTRRRGGRDTGTSHHLVAIQTRGAARHDRHDLLVVIVRGHGTMRMGDAALPVGERSILYVPRGTVHAFTNQSDAPAVAYAVYTPPFDGKDRVDADSPRP